MRLLTDGFISYKEYLDMIDDDVAVFENMFIEELENEHAVDIFRDIIIKDKVLVSFDPEEERKYKGKPKILSNDVYGTPHLYFIIMKLNNLNHPTDLDTSKKVYMMNPKNVSKLLSAYQNLKNKI